ncbi:MAG: hypothetical protein LKJ90_09825, partial [Faecalibacterium sp.]|nr:hypothetical protein [Faecalibacterium sp.]
MFFVRLLFVFWAYFAVRTRLQTVSMWLDCSGWMSKPRKISPFVLGNKSTAFLTSKLPFSRLLHIPFASCHLHGIFLPPCRTKPATVPGLSATASLVQRLCQKS